MSRPLGWVLASLASCLVGVFGAFVAFGWHLVVTQPLVRASSLRDAYAAMNPPVIAVSIGVWLALSVTVMSLVVHFQKGRGEILRGRPWLISAWLLSDATIAYAVTAFFSVLPWLVVNGQTESIMPSDLAPSAPNPYVPALIVMLLAPGLAMSLQLLVRGRLKNTTTGGRSDVTFGPSGGETR